MFTFGTKQTLNLLCRRESNNQLKGLLIDALPFQSFSAAPKVTHETLDSIGQH